MKLVLLATSVPADWEILSLDQMVALINRYRGFEGYSKLVEEVGPETDQKLIELAHLFTEYHNSLIALYYADPSIYYPKGYARILNIIPN